MEDKNKEILEEVIVIEEGTSIEEDVNQNNVSVMCGINNSHLIKR